MWQRLLEEPESFDEGSLSTVIGPTDGSPTFPTPLQAVLETIRSDFDQRTWQCFWSVAVDGDSASEVAEKLGMRPAAVRQAKYRVTKRLRSDLRDLSSNSS